MYNRHARRSGNGETRGDMWCDEGGEVGCSEVASRVGLGHGNGGLLICGGEVRIDCREGRILRRCWKPERLPFKLLAESSAAFELLLEASASLRDGELEERRSR